MSTDAASPNPNPNAEMPSAASASPRFVGWGTYLVTALLATVLAGVSVQLTRKYWRVDLPQRYFEITSQDQPPADEAAEAMDLYQTNRGDNFRRILGGLAAVVAASFGLIIGMRSGGIGRGALAAVVGVAAAFALAWLCAPMITKFNYEQRLEQGDALVKAIQLHSFSWSTVVIALGITLGMATASIKGGIQGLIIAAVGAAIGVIVAVLGGATWDPLNSVEDAVIVGWRAFFLWSVLPVFVAGLLLTWGAFRSPQLAARRA